MANTFKVLLFILSVFICSTTVSAKDVNLLNKETCKSFFGREQNVGHAIFELDADGTLVSYSQDSWTAKMKEIGSGGIWGGTVYYEDIDVSPTKRKYEISFDMISTGCDKIIFIGFKDKDFNIFVWGDWIKLKKGKTYHYNRIVNFSTKATKKVTLYFGAGGEFNKREADQSIYEYVINSTESFKLSDNSEYDSTTIKCSNLYFGSEIKAPKTAKVKKCTRTNKKIKLSYKQVDAVKYQIKYSTNKKFKKKNTNTITTKKSNYTIKCKKNKKYYIKVRAIKKLYGRTFYGKWSSTKII